MWLATSFVRRRFWPPAPWNLALAILVFMAAVGAACSAVWELTFPKVTGLILGLAVYRALAEFARDRRSLLLALAGLVVLTIGFSVVGFLMGELRAYKIPPIAALRGLIPQVDHALPGTQGGRVSTNQLGGTLLYILPLLIGPLLIWRRPLDIPRREWTLWLGLCALGAAILSIALLLTQSRGAWVGLMAGLACLLGLRWRWGRWVLLAGVVALGVGAWRFWPQILGQLTPTGLTSPGTLIWRVGVWERSIGYLGDVPFTGYGLGTFRAVDTLFFGPGFIASGGSEPVFDVGVPHAHNVFLQMGFDTGIPGLLAYLAILLLATRECWLLARRGSWLYATLGMGALAALVASHVFGLTDVVALGAKPGVLWWGLLALIAVMPNHGINHQDTKNTKG
jgi:O-antigen ligase